MRRSRQRSFLLATSLTIALATSLPPVVAATSYAHGPIAVEQAIDLRSLPSLLVEWRWEGTVDEWRTEDDIAFVVGGDRLSAVDLRTGEVRWAYDLNLDCSCSKLELLPTRVVAGIDGRALLIDRGSGAVVADVELGESISALIPDPLIVAYRDSLGLEGVVRLDESSGVERARYSPVGGVSEIERVGDRLLVTTRVDNPPGRSVAGLDLSLVELWRQDLPSNSWSSSNDGEVVVHSIVGGEEVVQILDPQTGVLLPRPNDSSRNRTPEDVRVEVLAAGLALVIEGGEPPMLIQPRTGGSGDPRWEQELPVVAAASVEWGNRVVLANEPWGARSVVMIVDTRDGEILTLAAGLRRMRKLSVLGDLLISETASGLAAVRLDDFGPPEAASITLAEAVARILAEVADPDGPVSPYAVQEELQSLGAAAFPYLTDAISEVRVGVLEVVARIVSEGGYEPAALPLARRIATLLDELPGDDEEEGWDPLPTLGAALAEIATAEEAPTLTRLLEAGPLGAYVRLPLMAALGRISSARALSAIAYLRASQPPPGPWWRSPAAEPWVELAAQEGDPMQFEELATTGRIEEAYALVHAATTAMAESEDARWVVFQDDLFQSLGHWAAPVAADGSVGASYFVGPLPPAVNDEADPYSFPVLEAALDGGVLEVGFAGADRVAIGVDELQRDSDGDGLTDQLERFLSLDPRSADSDGDGRIDPEDLAPSGGLDRPSTEHESAFFALHETLGLATIHEEGAEGSTSVGIHSFLADAPPLEWRAGSAATFVVDDEPENDCRARSYRVGTSSPRPLSADELVVEVVISCAAYSESEFTETYVMRSTPVGWVLSGVGW